MRRLGPYLFVWLFLLISFWYSEQATATLAPAYLKLIPLSQQLSLDVYSLGEAPQTITKVNEQLKSKEKAWLTNYLQDGTWALDSKEYLITYDFFNTRPVSYQLQSENTNVIASEPNIFIKGTKVALNAFFTPVFSRYGVNCKGCSGQKSGRGNFSVGIGADVTKGVRQFNGKYLPGITFEGYYIVASDPAIPLCTILEISNHNFKGGGLTPGVPFYAVVLDRGGAIKKNRLDFYIGDERYYNSQIKYSGKRKPIARIVAFGKRAKDKSGKRSCALPKKDELVKNAQN